jgi:hypothetical protein
MNRRDAPTIADRRSPLLRHDWRLYTRHDAALFEKPAPYDPKRARREREEKAGAWPEWLADQDEIARLRIAIADLKFALALRRLREEKYSPTQPRVPAGNPDGGQWTREGAGRSTLSQDEGDRLVTAPNQTARPDLSQLQAIANDPQIRNRIDEAWNASNPYRVPPQEHGFWICRNEDTGELFTRPFANAGSAARITPGATPDDAIAFFHTHPNSPDAGFSAEPSSGDLNFASSVGLPGLLQSHRGMYYFGSPFRAQRAR